MRKYQEPVVQIQQLGKEDVIRTSEPLSMPNTFNVGGNETEISF